MIDRERVFQMAKTGFTKTEVAKRLNCSVRQVNRIIKKIESDKNIKLIPNFDLRDKDVEKAVRSMYRCYENDQQVANRFGIRRQSINKGAA